MQIQQQPPPPLQYQSTDEIAAVAQRRSFSYEKQEQHDENDTLLWLHGTRESSCSRRTLAWLSRAWLLGRVVELMFLVGVAGVIYYVFHNKTCDWMFECGCTWNWDGGWDACNIHNVDGPHCPYCMSAAPWTTSWLVMALSGLGYYMVQLLCWSAWYSLLADRVYPSIPALDASAKPLPEPWTHRVSALLLSWLTLGTRARRSSHVSQITLLAPCLKAVWVVSSTIGLLGMLLAFFVLNIVVGAIHWLASDYPTFLWFGHT